MCPTLRVARRGFVSTLSPGHRRLARLNIGPLKTIQLNWLQPHEGSIVDFLFRGRAFQFDKGMIRI